MVTWAICSEWYMPGLNLTSIVPASVMTYGMCKRQEDIRVMEEIRGWGWDVIPTMRMHSARMLFPQCICIWHKRRTKRCTQGRERNGGNKSELVTQGQADRKGEETENGRCQPNIYEHPCYATEQLQQLSKRQQWAWGQWQAGGGRECSPALVFKSKISREQTGKVEAFGHTLTVEEAPIPLTLRVQV